MFSVFKHEWRSGIRSLLIWSLSVGFMGLLCIVMYKSMESEMADMAESFASMGAFADAFGMSTLSIATVKGYFATEVGTIHSLGSALFAASIATVVLSKEEDGHTAEFTFTLPISRGRIVAMKVASVFLHLICFTAVCGALYGAGLYAVGAGDIGRDLAVFMSLQVLMNIEVAAICFVISAISRKNLPGAGIAVGLILYFFDLMGRAVPDLKDYLFLTPLGFCNATTVFSHAEMDKLALGLGILVIFLMTGLAGWIYVRRDLAS